ncbi:hypothetical protein [Methanosarcina sp.]|uniref:hypothetical protein n=1 Tax=Methanosarcina sp. TaxID=2213 RepID=UPI002AB8C5AF|nr:hypothetical protein [Methanosarcina sp.]MDY9927377.1 hypothetical protein [Methanosarcina sp.]
MQCFYLGGPGGQPLMGQKSDTCTIISNNLYETTEQDRNDYCITGKFPSCPRFTATIAMNKSKMSVIEYGNNIT